MIFDARYTTARPYAAAYAILRRDNKIAAVLRGHTGWMDGHYGLPSGKVEYGEPYTLGTIREVLEEVGVVIKLADLQHVHTCHRHSVDGKKYIDWVDLYFEVSNWEGEIENMEPKVHDRVDWLDLQNLPENVVPSVKAALEAIAKGEAYSEFGWDQ